jgi:ankyrin repeat protein
MSELDKIETAIARNNLAALKKLVSAKNVNSRDEDGFTLAMNVVLDDETDPQLLQLLVERGADVNAVDEQRYTALHFAARDQRCELVKILLEAGAHVDAVEAMGNTPLCLCASSSRPDLEIVKLLLQHGADQRKKNRDGDSPLSMAKYGEDDELLAVLKQKPAADRKRTAKPKAAVKTARKTVPKKKASKPAGDSWTRQYHKLRKELVPARGPANTLQGELLRLAGRLSYEAFNNGNMNWSKEYERAWKFLGKSLQDPEVFSRPEVAKIKLLVQTVVRHNDVVSSEIDGSPQDELCHRVVQWCLAHPKKIPFKPKKTLYSF